MSNCTHHFIIDSENVGRCKYCPEVRDFGRSLRREGVLYVAAGRRGAKARIEALKNRGRKKRQSPSPASIAKMSAAAKERWQNPEYRGKQRGAHGSLLGRHHKKGAMTVS